MRADISRLFSRRSSASPAPPRAARISPELLDEVGAVRSLAEDASARADFALAVARDMSLPAKMIALMAWLELSKPPSGPLISVILATRDRSKLLARAIPSVVAQRYERWQLVIVDDGDTDAVATTLAGNSDGRIVSVRGHRRGLSAARNAGLDHATGEIVCYLDDDNIMHPGWLHAVAHVFSQRKDIDIAYGISLAEHRLPNDLGEYGWWPSLWQLPWSRETLLKENVTDAGALAHRREMEGARFDESLSTGEDWDLLIRLTTNREALAVPALSHAYSMEGADRMSLDPNHRAGLEEIRHRHNGAS